VSITKNSPNISLYKSQNKSSAGKMAKNREEKSATSLLSVISFVKKNIAIIDKELIRGIISLDRKIKSIFKVHRIFADIPNKKLAKFQLSRYASPLNEKPFSKSSNMLKSIALFAKYKYTGVSYPKGTGVNPKTRRRKQKPSKKMRSNEKK
jgi:hypothetical protein